MATTKKRRDTEIYENYWTFTAAHTDITGTKFNNCLEVVVLFIDQHKSALEENAAANDDFSKSELYALLQQKVADISGFKGSDATLSARKVINQFVKIGFINPLLLGYHPLVKKFLMTSSKKEKEIIFSKIFYESSSLASDVTKDNRHLKHVNFLLQTLDKNGSLDKNDIIGLMVTDISNFKNGFLTKEQLEAQYRFAIAKGFDERKYNQIDHLTAYLKRFIDLKYDKTAQRFWFANDPVIADIDFEEKFKRDNVKHRIYKEELKCESIEIYGEPVCYLDKIPYKSLIASHIKPCIDCLREHNEREAYDKNNGLLLNPTIDSYFDKKDISFYEDGSIMFGKGVDSRVVEAFGKFKLDKAVLNTERQRYMAYHRELFKRKNGVI